jgi:GTPase
VGFIRKLPHTLVAAFKSTLESTLHDDVLLHLIDASHPLAEEHAHTTFEILKELKVSDVAIITVLNKIDRCKDMKILDRLRILYPKTVAISALHGTGFEDLMQQMIQELRERRKILKLKIPQSEYVLVAELKRYGKILSEEYEENDVLIKAEIPVANVHRFDAYKNE